MAILLRDKNNVIDLSGLARLRAMVRTSNLHVLHPALKLADGTLVAGNQRIDTGNDFLSVEVAFGNQRWYKLDPDKLTTTTEVRMVDHEDRRGRAGGSDAERRPRLGRISRTSRPSSSTPSRRRAQPRRASFLARRRNAQFFQVVPNPLQQHAAAIGTTVVGVKQARLTGGRLGVNRTPAFLDRFRRRRGACRCRDRSGRAARTRRAPVPPASARAVVRATASQR